MSVPAVVFVLCAAACVVAHVAILLSTVSSRARATAATAAADVPRPRAAVELVWALVPVVALAIVLTATWAHIQERAVPRPTMRVAQ